ncbi:MAG: DUF853 domain-containing protein [Bacteroidales bacterium]|nr:DUF853 domain-containing protein [Bacteroidales bacterium]
MFTEDEKLYVAHGEAGPIYLEGKMANRHGLIAGATGTGKTVSLQVLAETFSAAGVPCFMADVKGDLSGISQAGAMSKFIEKRKAEFGMDEIPFAGCPTRFYDVFGEQGHPMRTTISEMGPLMLSRLLSLNEVQTGALNMVFKIADDRGLLLIDIKDLRMMLDYVSKHAKEYTTTYGTVASASIGAIQRALLELETQGGDLFFGEPAFHVFDLMQTEQGKGVMNILASDRLLLSPKLYSTFLLWLLSELYTDLPEAGDLALPKLVFFFDEAHLLFDSTSKALVDKIEQVVRLIRSKGVGVYFITQSPTDIPETILGQLGNRIQHALRAFTPKDQKAVRAAAQTFRANPDFKTEEAIMELGTGEALVSFLDEKGAPSVVQRAKILFPLSYIGAITPEQRADLIKSSKLYGVYERTFDRESAYEMLTAQNESDARKAQAEKQMAEQEKELQRRQKELEAEKKRLEKTASSRSKTSSGTTKRKSSRSRQSAVEKAVNSAATSIGRSIGTQLVRSILGSILKK